MNATKIDLTLSAKVLPLKRGTTSEDIFGPMSHQAWAMWLDSGNSDHVDSRFDILVWQPIATLTTQADSTEICFPRTCIPDAYHPEKSISEKSIISSTDDPLLLLKQLQAHLFNVPNSTHEFLPFLGGALGYFAYDLGRRFEQLPSVAKQDINLPEMAVGLYDRAVIFDKSSATFYLVCADDQRSEIEKHLINSANITNQVNNTSFHLNSSWQANMDKASYIEKFNKVQSYLLSGDCYQINLAQRFSAQYQGDEFEAYLALKEANKAPFSAFIRLDNAAILSVSPERFLQLSQGKVQSKPIKGTMPRSDNKIQDAKNAEILRHSSKDNAENLMIVDLLRNDISRSCQAGTVKVPKLFDIESFPAVHHLVSTVEGILSSDKHATDLLRGAFPGGSITGAPKIRAMEIIEELEPHRRSVYCGSIGYLSNCGNMDTSITIRTLICQPNEASENSSVNDNKTIHCWAGGGLVADSTAQSEYQETFDKVNCILPVLSKLNQV
ncbi:aminodeoxychorismate synthase, component I [Colwellia sp. 75C3]|uniref:aminodeoxychorismate synthase component I n=1 Tax=Colwellia sp. 75C3 TaxID=888425 RepID=UPI000C3444AB|nr:aminodeoxychorismate synthase, component I [Colwellia sp. 75C3]